MSIRSNRNQMDVFKIFVLFSSQQSKVSEWFFCSVYKLRSKSLISSFYFQSGSYYSFITLPRAL